LTHLIHGFVTRSCIDITNIHPQFQSIGGDNSFLAYNDTQPIKDIKMKLLLTSALVVTLAAPAFAVESGADENRFGFGTANVEVTEGVSATSMKLLTALANEDRGSERNIMFTSDDMTASTKNSANAQAALNAILAAESGSER